MLRNFEAETGQAIDMKQCGYLFLLSTEEQMAQFRQNVAKQHRRRPESEVWTTAQIAARVPLLNLDGIIGGTYCADDGLANPSGVVNGYIAAAKLLGVQTIAGVSVIGIKVTNGAIEAVENQRRHDQNGHGG